MIDSAAYSYGDDHWGDLLTAFDGQEITYDGIGNPLTDGTWTYTWEHGRQLAGISGILNNPGASVRPLSGEKNGLYVDADGETRYYVNGAATYAGLIYWEGYYYYISSSLKAVKNRTYWVSKHNNLLPEANYEFAADGRMINAPTYPIEVDVSYTYGPDGLRAGKRVTSGYELASTDTVRDYRYVYNGSQLTYVEVDISKGGTVQETITMRISYDAVGPMFIKYNGVTYHYVTNLQGDMIALLDGMGDVVVEYTYDAWGNLQNVSGSLASTLGEYNPLRYRGYVYDTETGFYYLQSRYYDPQIGRFINADALIATGQGLLGNNMFAYCNNNPVNYSDTSGCLPTNAIYPVCIDGGDKPVIAISDHKEDSDELLDHIISNYLPITNSTVYITVESLGTYSHVNDNTASKVITTIGIASCVILLIPVVREYAVLAKTLEYIGIASTLYGITTFLPPNELQNRDYSQYSVTITWSETTNATGYPNVFVTTDYTIDMLFVLDDDDTSDICWYLQSSNIQEVRSVNRKN